jgi:hypothetical protein
MSRLKPRPTVTIYEIACSEINSEKLTVRKKVHGWNGYANSASKSGVSWSGRRVRKTHHWDLSSSIAGEQFFLVGAFRNIKLSKSLLRCIRAYMR